MGPVLALAFTLALVVAATVFYTAWDLLGAREVKTEQRIDSKTLFEPVKLSFGVVAGASALVALVVAYRRQRVDEDGALRDATRLHTERFATAVSQLGDDSAAVRLGGVPEYDAEAAGEAPGLREALGLDESAATRTGADDAEQRARALVQAMEDAGWVPKAVPEVCAAVPAERRGQVAATLDFVEPDEVGARLAGHPEVTEVHDLHVW